VERPYFLKLKGIFDEQVKIATAETEKLPFAISHRILQIYISIWSALSKCLDFVANPHNPYGPRVVNLPSEEDDRKRKADRSSLTASSPSVDEDALSGAQRRDPDADDNMDRQNPEGSGGNLI
jgi:hypothetical protein